MILNHNELYDKYNIIQTPENKRLVKSILTAMESNNLSTLRNQKIVFDDKIFEKLYNISIVLKDFFDYRYNVRVDLEKIFEYILTSDIDNKINFYAIFCPGYTENGYKEKIGRTTHKKIIQLKELKERLIESHIDCNFYCLYADIFVENFNYELNPNWEVELEYNKKIFCEFVVQYFSNKEIKFLSDIFSDDTYKKGFVDNDLLIGKNYEKFQSYNKKFYQEMGWDDEKIKYRNDRLYTIYTIIAKYISNQNNGVYLPMENMYARTKVFTKNDVCSMYLNL